MNSFEATPPFGVVGLGLMGGSVARALKAVFPKGEIIGVDPDPRARRGALDAVVVDRALEGPSNALTDCSLIFVCVPVDHIEKVFGELAPYLGEQTLVTDVTGIKEPVAQWATAAFGANRFVGCHPMAGKPKRGFEFSAANLFDRAIVAICPPASWSDEQAEPLADLWRRMGAKPKIMPAKKHDALIAFTSQLPYVVAVGEMLLLTEDADRQQLIGRGFREATRYAGFSHEIMAAVLARNPSCASVVRRMSDELKQLADLLDKDPQRFMELADEAQKIREKLDG